MQLARCITDQRMIIADVDEAFANLLHEHPSSLRGRNIYDLTHPNDLVTNRQLLDDLREKSQPFSIVTRYLRSDGSIIWVNNHVSLASTQHGDAQIVATVRQIEAPNRYSEKRLLQLAERILSVRSARTKIFGGGVFGEPDYEIMLDLFVNESRGRKVSISSACVASGVPPTTALRHITAMIERGWIERTSDPHDRRSANLMLTLESLVKVRQYLEEGLKA